LWLSGRYRIGIEKATKLHETTVRKIENEEEGKVNPLCHCGRVARQFSRIANRWLCSKCWNMEVGERR
jgi:hypothetical protein